LTSLISLKWLSLAKLKARSEASRQEKKLITFVAKLRFALLASLRSAILAKLKKRTIWLLYPQGLEIEKLKKFELFIKIKRVF